MLNRRYCLGRTTKANECVHNFQFICHQIFTSINDFLGQSLIGNQGNWALKLP